MSVIATETFYLFDKIQQSLKKNDASSTLVSLRVFVETITIRQALVNENLIRHLDLILWNGYKFQIEVNMAGQMRKKTFFLVNPVRNRDRDTS